MTADPSGISEVAVLKDGERHFEREFDGSSREEIDVTEFQVGAIETTFDSFSKTTVDVYAEDAHGNAGQETIYTRGNFYSYLLEETGATAIEDPRLARNAGMISGYTASLGSSLNGMKEFIENPLGFVEGVRGLVALAKETGLLDLLIEVFAEEFEDYQRANNPYDEEEQPELYQEFRVSWYSGYVVGFLAEAAVGSAAAKAVKGTSSYQRVADRLSDTRVAGAYRTATAPGRKAKATVASGAARVSGKAVGAVVGGAKSAGKSYRMWQLARQVEGPCGAGVGTADVCERLWRHLDETEQTNARQVLEETDSSALLNELGHTYGVTDLRRFLGLDIDGVDTANLRRNLALLHKRGDIDAEDVRRFTRNAERFSNRKGVDKSIERIASGNAHRSNFRGTDTELQIAKAIEEDGGKIIEFDRKLKTKKGSTDADLVTDDGRLIEVKSGDYGNADKNSGKYEDLARKISRYNAYHEDGPWDVEVHFMSDPHPDIVNKLKKEDVTPKVYKNGKFVTL